MHHAKRDLHSASAKTGKFAGKTIKDFTLARIGLTRKRAERRKMESDRREANIASAMKEDKCGLDLNRREG